MPRGIAGIDALRRKAEEEILADRQSALLELRQHQLARGPGIGRRLEHDELPFAQRRRYRFGRGDDVRHVRILGLSERSRDADRHDVALAEHAHVERRFETAQPAHLGDVRAGDVLDVAVAGIHDVHDAIRLLEADDLEPRLRHFDREREPNVAESDDAARERPRFDARTK
jgi:hypothetical protein